MKVLVIGGCGFIGSHVVDKCLQQGLSVRVMDTRPELYRPPLPGVDYVFHSLSDHHRLADTLSGVDAVVHLASTTVPSTSNLDPAADISGNLVPTVRLLDAMRASGTRSTGVSGRRSGQGQGIFCSIMFSCDVNALFIRY